MENIPFTTTFALSLHSGERAVTSIMNDLKLYDTNRTWGTINYVALKLGANEMCTKFAFHSDIQSCPFVLSVVGFSLSMSGYNSSRPRNPFLLSVLCHADHTRQ